ncbi:uncharacterized protein LOC141685100 [Apium graveolens]|uniref:uncharacterized protein LOC141685100 n=1 Tax=Apium graveolens TaxID=4045 RepID=UPI003D7A4C47
MKLKDIQGPVYEFRNHVVPVQGAIDIPTTFDTSPHEVIAMVKYYIIDMASPYNAIIGQPTLFFLGAIISSTNMKVKFPTPMGPETSLKKAELYHTPKVEPEEPVENTELMEGDPTRYISIRSRPRPPLKQKLIQLLREFLDIFAWKPEDMSGLDESIIIHRLHLDPNKIVVKQKRRNFAPERQQAIDEEINKLLKAKFIYEIQFSEWISNVALVKKTSGKWRVCIDNTDLNKATPKDYYPQCFLQLSRCILGI